MGKYRITDHQTGKSVVVSGDAAPNDQEAEQIFADAGLRSAPHGQSAPAQQAPGMMDTAIDMVRSIPAGLGHAAAGMMGYGGDLRDAAGGLVGAVAGRFGFDGDKAADKTKRVIDRVAMAGLPIPMQNSADVNNLISSPTGGYYEPKTTAGKYAETVASFAPAAISPGSLPARIARVAVPGIASEAAGQATKGSKYEPLARAGGALAGGIATGLGESLITSKLNPSPTAQELSSAKDAAYKAAEAEGVIIKPDAFQKFATDLGVEITKKNVVQADIHKNALAALNIIQDEAASGVPITLERADAIRQAVNGAIEQAGNGSDLRLAMKVKNGLDDFLDGLSPQDTLAGDAQKAVSILKEARTLAQREFKSKEIQKLIDLAENSASSNYSASGVEQALRAQFKNFNAKIIKDPSLAKSFTSAERDAIENVAQGGPVGNALRLFGKMAPTNNISMAAGPSLGAAGGAAVGGPVGAAIGAAAVPAIGAVSRLGATALTKRNAALAAELMRRGVAPQTSGQSASLIADLLLSQQGARH